MSRYETIPLWNGEPPYGEGTEPKQHPTLTLYPAEGARGLVVVLPGGGYGGLAGHEGGPVAEWLNGIGISAVVLKYRVSPYRHPAPLADASRAIRYARHLAGEWGHSPDKIGILGFSAGGHLAASAGTLFGIGHPESADPVERLDGRPDAMVLCYPVITFGEYRHHGSMMNLLGDDPTPEWRNQMSIERQVGAATPPAFIWFTDDDQAVPVENGLLMAQALSRHKIPYELHVFEHGRHGLGLCDEDLTARAWTQLCEAWLRKQGF
ncbi:alpha/beta hydrolase fold domain-containing protein [Cohnella sp. CFH 77786]|uniref:alpha/beta hydrolase n=1 Tax=Cohnella sp. CFH 77786 TaxID=2662265 RepID=UPI001C60CFE1|nr:alpha/beta hydrolase [Cohnella sp. CFH 77786]MBW5448285.1 alpha/beta hydrolase fold domain-containing protein [Cohnella sp. CFH 77786]